MLALILVGCGLLGAEPAPASDPAAQVRVGKLRQDLSHPQFAIRQQTTTALVKGDPQQLLPDLQAVIAQGPPEAAVRAVEVLLSWYSQPERVTEELEDAVEQLKEKSGAVRELATVAWEDQQSQRDRRAVAQLQALGAKVVFVKPKQNELLIDRDDIELSTEPIVQHVVLGRGWNGGDAGLKHIARLSYIQTGVYRVKTAKVSEEALQRLTDRKPDLKIEIRGAFLGVTWSSGGFGFGGPQPCLISEVAPNSPAEKGGLKKEDIITKFGDKPVETFPDLIDFLKSTDPGEKVMFTVMRDGAELRLPIELGDW